MVYNGIKNYIHGLKSYASSKPTCFFWLIIGRMAEEKNLTPSFLRAWLIGIMEK